MATRYFALIFGIIYLVIGILGFFPAFMGGMHLMRDMTVTSSEGYLFGLFPVNVLHNLVHVVIGLWGIFSFGRFGAARVYARSVAVIFAILTILGLIPGANILWGILPLYGNDIWLHALTAIVAAYFGWAVVPETGRGYVREVR